MANEQNRSVFMPLDASAYEGPFEGFLKPTQQQEQSAQAGPPVLASKSTSLGYLATKFIAGAAQGRIKAFEQQENEKLKNLEVLKNYVTQINARDDLTPAAKNYTNAQYSRALGVDLHNAADGGDGKGKKGKKTQGAPAEPDPTKAEPDPKKAGPGGGLLTDHLKNMAKDLAVGMVGGKMPKGAPQVNTNEIIGQITREISKPEYSIPGIVSQNTSDMERKSKELLEKNPNATEADFMRVVMPHVSALQALGGDHAAKALAPYQSIYPKGPQNPEEKMRWDLFSQDGRTKDAAAPTPQAGGVPQPQIGKVVTYIGHNGDSIRSMHGTEHSGAPPSPPEPPPYLRRNEQAQPEQAGPPMAPRSLRDVYAESLYGKRERVNLADPKDPSKQVSAEYNPRYGLYEDPATGIPLPPAQQGWLKETGVYHAPRETLQKIGVVKDDKGVDRFQVYDPNTGKYTLTPGQAYERTTSSEVAEWRKEEAFSNKETAIYTRYASNVQSIEARHNTETMRIGMDTSKTPDDKKKLLDENEAQRKNALAQAEKDRNQLLEIHYRSHKKTFVKDGGGGDGSGGSEGSGKVVKVPDKVMSLLPGG